MKHQLSQNYGVDNRYRGLEEAQDNAAGMRFLSQYMERDRQGAQDDITAQRQGDDRFEASRGAAEAENEARPLRGPKALRISPRRAGNHR